MADIAGLAGFSHNRDATKVDLTHFDAAGLQDRIAVVRDAAGDRFDAIELNALIQFVVHTDDREAAAAELAAAFGGVSPEFVLDSPFVLLGTHEQMAEALVERQQRFGVSYWTVFDEWVGRPVGHAGHRESHCAASLVCDFGALYGRSRVRFRAEIAVRPVGGPGRAPHAAARP